MLFAKHNVSKSSIDVISHLKVRGLSEALASLIQVSRAVSRGR